MDMKISFNPIYSPQFKSSSSFYKTQEGKEIGTFTWFFRQDLDWKRFIEYQTELFKNKDNVNIVQFGASDGTEAYTYLMSFFEYADEKDIAKFCPIEAYDIKESMVKMASDGYINISSTDKENMDKLGINWEKSFRLAKTEPYYNNTTLYLTKSRLKQRVNFNHGDMFQILPTLKDESNTILLCRNCLGYFDDTPQKIYQFIKTVSEVLKKDSLFVTGNLEAEIPYIESFLRQSNFEPVMRNVFKKL